MIKGIPDRIFYVVFRKADYKDMPIFWRYFLQALFFFKRSGWEHVDIFFEDQAGQVIFIGVAPWQIGILETGLTLKETLTKLRGTTTACVEIVSNTRYDSYLPRGILSCSSVVKAILGVRGGFLCRPKHIFNVLKEKGGTILWQPQLCR